MGSIDDATPTQWDKARMQYVKSIDERIVEEESHWTDNVRDEETYRPTLDDLTGRVFSDMVDKPAHYNKGGIECIDYIEQQLGEGFIEYCEGNVHKYLHRWRYKNGSEDLQKARWYLQRMIQKVLEVGE